MASLLAEAIECLCQEGVGDPDGVGGLGTDRVGDAAGRISAPSHKNSRIVEVSVPVIFAPCNRGLSTVASVVLARQSWAIWREGGRE